MPVYDLAQIRKLLAAAFSSGDINTLAFDLFYELHGDFAAGMSKSVRIERIVEEAERNGRIPHLLAYVQKENPYQYNHFAPRLTREEPAPTASAKRAGWRQRQADLERHIKADLQLLAEYEEALRLEDDPRRRLGHRKNIERQRRALARYRRELETLERDIEEESTAAADNQPLLAAIADLKQTVTRRHDEAQGERAQMARQLTAGQQAIVQRIDAQHRETVAALAARLDENQVELVELLLDAHDQGQIAQWRGEQLLLLTQQALLDLKRLRQGQPEGEQWQSLLELLQGETNWEQKLKLTMPLIPGILAVESEAYVEVLPALKRSWRGLVERIRE